MHVAPLLPCYHRLMGHPESGSAPPSFARIRTLLLCIGISIELPEPEHCRGTVSVIIAVASFLFATMTYAPYNALVNLFIIIA